uniref:Cytochrome P450 2U1 n=1 Tax=Phallusia mammillata TaxID=59560 RepID=A0A6F9DB72_9ASCI|nr:cytochrome P450 2U1 [Phallusia mammillata]
MTVETQQASNFNPGFLPLFCLLSVLLFYVWRRRPRLFPPGPKGLPVVGVIPFLYRDPPRMLRDWSNKYGSVMAVRMGRNEVIVLSGYKTIQEAFVTKSDAFSGRPYSLVMHKIFHKNLGLSFLDYNQTWKGQRQFGIRALKGVGIGRKSIESRIMEEMEYYVEWLVKMEGKPINLRTFLTSAVANVIANIMFGRRFEYNSEELQKIVDIFEESFSLGSTGALFYMTMFESSLRFVPPFRGAYLKISANLDYMRDFIRRHISTHVESFDKNDYRDFCDAFYAEMTKEGNQSNGDFHVRK